MIKVLMVSCEGLGNGGVQSVMINIIRNLKNEMHFDMLLFTSEHRYYDDEFEQYGRIFRIPKYEGRNRIRSRLDYYIRYNRIYRRTKDILLREGPYDVIHCNNYFESAACLKAAAECGVKVRIAHSHSAVPESEEHIWTRVYQNRLQKGVLFWATDLIGCSSPAADYLFGKGTKHNGKRYVITNCIDLARFDRSRYAPDKRRHSFIHVGAMGEVKNQKFVLRVFVQIWEKCRDATLVFIGSGEEGYLKEMKDLTKAFGIEAYVQFLPHDADVPKYLAEAEYMIFPSRYEGFSLASVEAQAMGVFVYASNAVPREADLGRMVFWETGEGEVFWANKILEDMNRPKKTADIDINKAGLENYVNKMRLVYQGGYSG
ncbi:MAG: glycosyltransferase family 1 protein [Lachnospiraceae bacterium]|jgi:glycosyltransferase involved in cell wall biosynthesis|nr:glycosyltransferase family 1 protein [Lachnospiraceae bacterium]